MTFGPIVEVSLTGQAAAVIEDVVAPAEIGGWIGKAFASVATALAQHGYGPVGPPFGRFRMLGDGTIRAQAGFPVATAVPAGLAYVIVELPGGPAATIVHEGPYDAVAPAYEALAAWLAERGLEPKGDAWEVYLTDPDTHPDPRTWRTEVVQPCRGRQDVTGS